MKYSREVFKKTWGIVSIVLSLVAIIAANYSKIFDDIIKWIGPEKNEVDVYSGIFNIYTKILLSAIIVIVFSLIYIAFLLLYDIRTLSLRKHKEQDVLDYLKKKKDIKKLLIFGYSLSFAEGIRWELEQNGKTAIDVEIIAPSDAFINEKLIDDQSKQSRVEELKARLSQWEKLKQSGRIRSVSIKRTDSVPIENGFVVDDEISFVDYYKWTKSGDVYQLSKKPKSDRGFLKIQKNHLELFDYIVYQLKLK